jgi:hypothetical protein
MAQRALKWGLIAALAASAGALSVARAQPSPDGASQVGGAETGSAETGAPAVEATSLRLQSEVLYTVVGKPVTLFHFFAVAPDCGLAAAEVVVTVPPGHGQVRFAEGAEPPVAPGGPIWRAPDPRARCVSHLVATRDAVYLPAPGFSGQDSFTVQFRAAGETFDDAVVVNVEKLGGPQPDWEHQRPRPAAKPGPGG